MEAVEKRPGQWKEGEGQQDVTGPSHAGVKLMQGAPQAHGPQLLHHRAPSPLLLLQAERANSSRSANLHSLCTYS